MDHDPEPPREDVPPSAGDAPPGPGHLPPDQPVSDVDASGEVVPIDLRDYVDFDTAAATRVRALSTPALALDQWCIEPQQSTGVMQFPRADVAYTVIGGRSWFVTEQGEVGLDPLGSLLVPAGTVHGIDNRGSDPLIVIAAISPPDALDTTTPDQPLQAAIRDDEQYGRLGRALSDRFARLLGRD